LVIFDVGVGVKEEGLVREEGVVEEEGVVKLVVEVEVVGRSGEERVVVMVVGLL
jgi:hypothetical protein